MIRTISIYEGNIFFTFFLCSTILQLDAMLNSSQFQFKKLGFHTSGSYCLFCKHFSVGFLFSLSYLIFSIKNEKHLKKDKKSQFISFMSVIFCCIIMAIMYIKETPQETVSVYFVYKILKAYPIWNRAFEPPFKWFPAAACALTLLIIIKHSSKKKCSFKAYFKSTFTVKY